MSRYYKNIILCGEIDYYCLLCEETFEFPEQVEKHIRWEQHRKNMKGVSYNSSHKKDFIFKIRDYFYCEICNHAADFTTVNVHINDYKHLFRKTNPQEANTKPNCLVSRQNNGTVNYHNMTMGKYQWHGIVNNHYVLCNTPIQNVEHIQGSDHMIALVQSRMMIDDDDQYIRKINDYAMYCFTCHKFFAKGSNHNHAPDGLTKSDDIKECDNEKEDKDKENEKEDISNKILTIADEGNEQFNTALSKERKYFYIDLDNSNARCIQCKSSISAITLSLLIAHRRAHCVENDDSESSDDSEDIPTTTELVDHGKHRSLIAQYGKRHYIKLNENGSKGYCSLCDVNISAHLNMIKQHVRGTRHQGMLFARRLKNGLHYDNEIRPLPTMKTFRTYIKQISFESEIQFVCLNNNICVDINSFLLMLPMQCSKKCFICNKVYKCTELNQHCNSDEHFSKLISMYVMVIDYDAELANEFVRKVQPDLYHCGFCNKMMPYWDITHLHLKSRDHITNRKYNQIIHSDNEAHFNKSTFVGRKSKAALLKKLRNLNFNHTLCFGKIKPL